MNSTSAAEMVFEKLREAMTANFKIAAFVHKGKLKLTKPTTQLFDEAMEKHPDCLVGIYQAGAKLDWIKQDMIEAGVKP